MKHRTSKIAAAVSVLAIAFSTTSHAQIPVTDVGAIMQLVTQLTTLQQQLETLQGHLRQAQQEYQSITGGRGMQNLLSGTVRNYLPSDWQALQASVTHASSSYSGLSSAIRQAINANAVLTAPQLSGLSLAERTQLEGSRQSIATLQAITGQALSTISGRFSSIQQLITAIGSAQDQKGILDLQARISAEQGMLANDQSKLQVIFQAAQAQQWANQQKSRELALNDIGSLRLLPAMGL